MKADKKQAAQIIFACSLVYMISYVTRNSYNAIIAEMVTSTGLPKSTLSIALTGAFITYGLGQLISGVFGDKVQPKILIAIGLVATSVMNSLIPICQNATQMAIVWCCNGFAQSFMWPPIVKILFTALTAEDYSRGCVKVSWGSSLGNIFVYLTAPVLILFLGWRSVFWTAAAMGVLGLTLWLKLCPIIDMNAGVKKKSAGSGSHGISLIIPLILVMLGIVFQGLLKDGVTTWMPSYISETFHLSNEISILAGVILPLFSIFCFSIANYLYLRLKNPIVCSVLIFVVSAVVCGVLYLLSNHNALISIALSAVITGCMHGVNFMLIGIAPTIFGKDGNVSTYSGILNCTAYIGSALSSWVIPLATENAGWTATLFLWLCIAGAGILVSALCLAPWKRMTAK